MSLGAGYCEASLGRPVGWSWSWSLELDEVPDQGLIFSATPCWEDGFVLLGHLPQARSAVEEWYGSEQAGTSLADIMERDTCVSQLRES